MKRRAVLLMCLLMGVPYSLKAETLSLEAFLRQVETQNGEVKAAKTMSRSSLDQQDQAELPMGPSLFANALHSDDGRPTVTKAFQGNKTIYQQYQLGFEQKFIATGTEAKVYYESAHTNILGVDSTYVPMNQFYDNRPVIEITQPLWRNGFGRTSRARVSAGRTQALAQSFAHQFRYQNLIGQAETIYWRLSLARDSVKLKEESLRRAQRLLEWAQRRAKLELTDQSDFLQAQANLEYRNLELQAALDEVREAEILFNQARGVEGDTVTETLMSLDEVDYEKIKPVLNGVRADLRAAEYEKQAKLALANLSHEEIKPQLDLKASYYLTGRSEDFDESSSESFKGDHPTSMVSLNFSFPLDIGLKKKLKSSYDGQKLAAELTYDRKKFEVEKEKSQLLQKLERAKERLKLARKIEKLQKTKLAYEEARHRKGRTTTYQVLQFEQDYSASQLARLSEQATILQIAAQLKLFGGEQ